MKIAKRTLALVVAMLMLVGTCTVAATAASALQAQIDAAGDGDTVTLAADATGSVVIDKNLTLDLGGHQLTGSEGQPAITIKNADVTVTNGHVYSKFAAVRTVTMIETVKDESPAAIRVEGGSVVVDGVRAAGSFTRIPGQQKYALPTGSAVELLNGATATICNATLVGRYGVNNKVTGQQAGGTVTIEDGILIGFMRAVKDSSKEVLSGAEKVNVADRIEGFLNSGIKLEAREKRLLKQVFAERAFVYTQSVQDDAVVTIDACADGTPLSATVTAHEDQSNLWQNTTSTDCSYKYVPEYAVLADGTLIKLEKDGDDYTAELALDQTDDVTIKYRLEFEMQPDIKRWTTNFDKYLQKLYDLIITTADSLYDELCNKYDKYVALANEVFVKVDELGMTSIPASQGRLLCDVGEYQRMVHLLLDLGGETMYFAGDTTQHFSGGQLEYFYGDENYTLDDGEYYGVLDHVAEMKATFEALRGESFADQSKWADLGYWLYENYPTVIEMIDDASDKVGALQDALSTDLAQAALQQGGLEKYQATLDKIENVLAEVQDVIEMLLGSHTIGAVLTKLENNKTEIKPYINKMIFIYNNYEIYFTPEKYIDGDFAKAYSVRGATEVETDVADEHQWDDGEVTKAATCTEPGEMLFTCEKCGATKTEAIEATDHDWGDWTKLDDDQHQRVCGNDNCPIGTETEAHEWDDGEVTKDPTCTEPGEILYKCTKCDAEKTETIEATDHDWGDWTKLDDEKHQRVCGNDNCPIGTETADHVWDDGEVTKAATCTEPGETLYTCKDCSATKTETIQPTDHAWGEWINLDANQHQRTCGNANCPIGTETEDHDFKEDLTLYVAPTEYEAGVRVYKCEACSAEKTEILDKLPHTHKFDDGVVTPATCTEGGYTTYSCKECTYSEQRDLTDPLRHDWDVDNIAITWAEDNSTCTATCYCKRDRSHTITETVQTEYNVIEDEECGKAGLGRYTAVFTKENLPQNAEKDVTIAALEHDYQPTNTVKPSCTEGGYTTYTCTHCGDSYDSDKTPKLGHDWGDGEVTTAPTCEETGIRLYTCSRCSETKEETIGALGHKYNDVVTEPTCTEQGYTTHTCERDATHTYVDTYVDALGHDWGNWQIVRQATPDAPGEKKRVCKRCGEEEVAPIEELLLHSSVDDQTGSNLIVNVPYARRGKLATQLTASEEVTYTSSNPQILQVDKDGNVTFARLCLFCKTATITAVSTDGSKVATCTVNIQIKWWQYIIWVLLGSFWF